MTLFRKFAHSCLLLTLLGCSSLQAAEVNITASFSPSMSNPGNDKFTNTTPQGGYCATFPQECTGNIFSILTPLTLTRTVMIKANGDPRNSLYFHMPGAYRNVPVINRETGATATIQFRINLFAARYSPYPANSNVTWIGNGFVNAPSPCSYTGNGWLSNGYWYEFAWKWPTQNVACYKLSREDRTDPSNVTNISMGYDLIAPDPLRLESGIYDGSLSFNIGPGGDIDFGDNFVVSNGDNTLTFNFTLSVNHELKLTTNPEDTEVSLQPCASGRVCSESEGSANWERTLITGIAPPALTGKTSFRLSSSGSFTTFLQCEFQSGENCGIRSEKTGQIVPVNTFITLPSSIVNMANNTVTRQKLYAGKDLTRNVFYTQAFGQNQPGAIDFQVEQPVIKSMLTTRPDLYQGLITVVFDPLIH